MPPTSLIKSFEAARARHVAAVDELAPLLAEMAVAAVADVLPGAVTLETMGEMNEDWVFTLRVQRVLDVDGGVLYDLDAGHPDAEVEEAVHDAGADFLDLLLDITGDDYLGRGVIRTRPRTNP